MNEIIWDDARLYYHFRNLVSFSLSPMGKKLVILIQLEIEGNLNRCISHSSCDVHKWRSNILLLVVGLVVKSLAYNMERDITTIRQQLPLKSSTRIRKKESIVYYR